MLQPNEDSLQQLLSVDISFLGEKTGSYFAICGFASLATIWFLGAGRGYVLPKLNVLSTALRFGGHLASLRVVERYIDDPHDATNTLRILQTMTCTDDHIRKIIADVGGIETAVKAMKRFSEENEGVAASGCGLLQNICGHDKKSDLRVLECGGISAIVRAMKSWPENEIV